MKLHHFAKRTAFLSKAFYNQHPLNIESNLQFRGLSPMAREMLAVLLLVDGPEGARISHRCLRLTNLKNSLAKSGPREKR